MRTPMEWKDEFNRRQGYTQRTSAWVAMWPQDIKEVQDEAFEAGKQNNHEWQAKPSEE